MPHVDEDAGGDAGFIIVLFLFYPAFPLDGAQLDGEYLKLLRVNLSERLAGDAGILTESVNSVPVGGVNAQLLHQLQACAAFSSELFPDTFHELIVAGHFLHIIAHLVILLHGSLMQMDCPAVCVLFNQSLLFGTG